MRAVRFTFQPTVDNLSGTLPALVAPVKGNMSRLKNRRFGYWGPPGKFVWWADGTTHNIPEMTEVHLRNAISAITGAKMLKCDHEKVEELRKALQRYR